MHDTDWEVPEVPSTAALLWYVDDPNPEAVLRPQPAADPEAALALAKQLEPDCDVVPAATSALRTWPGPDRSSLCIGCFPGVTVVGTVHAALAQPTGLPTSLIRPLAFEHTYLTSYDCARGWGAFAHWERGELRRSFSATRANILENHGLPLVWERSFWAGEHPVQLQAGQCPDPQMLPFDPPCFADHALGQWLGFRYPVRNCHQERRGDQARGSWDVGVCGFSLYPQGTAPRAAEPIIANRWFARWLNRGLVAGRSNS